MTIIQDKIFISRAVKRVNFTEYFLQKKETNNVIMLTPKKGIFPIYELNLPNKDTSAELI